MIAQGARRCMRIGLGLLLVSCGLTSSLQADPLPTGYKISTGTTIWDASGAGPNNGLSSVVTYTSGTASCGTPSTVTRSQIDESAFPGAAVAAIPGSGSYIKVVMSGGSSGGNCSIDLDTVDGGPGVGLIGQFFFFAPGYNDNTNALTIKWQTAGGADRLVIDVNSTTTYHRRQEGWNLVQGHCNAALAAPDWFVQAGAPTCSSNFIVYTIQATIAANTTITMYFGDVVKRYYARPQVAVWAADGDNTAKTVMESYMTARGMKGSYAPTVGEIGGGANPMSLADLLSLSTAGWSIHPHQSGTLVGPYTALSDSALASELTLVRSLFASQGIPMSRFYFPPGGNCDLRVLAALNAARFIGQGCNGNISEDDNGRPIYGGMVNWNATWNITAENNTSAENIAIIDHVVKYGEQVSLLWHKVDGTVTCGVTCFQATMNYLYRLQSANVLDVVTWDELYSRQLSPRRKR